MSDPNAFKPEDPGTDPPEGPTPGPAAKDGAKKPKGPSRPLSAIFALISMWILGITITDQGLFTIGVIRNPFADVGYATLQQLTLSEVQQAALVRATMDNAAVALPIAAAQLVLGGLLLFASLRALLSRQGVGTFGMQVVVANLALSVVEFFATAPIRAGVIEAVTTSKLPDLANLDLAQNGWILNVGFLIRPAALLFCVLALGRWRKLEQALSAAASEPKPDRDF